MLNPFYWYAGIWSVILISYHFYLSNIQIRLSLDTIIFLGVTIIVSIALGYRLKEKFKFHKIDDFNDHYSTKTVALVAGLNIIEFIYCGQIPLFSVILGKVQYAEYTGIPTLHVIIVTFTMFYSIYLAYLYINLKQRKYLFNFGILLLILVLLLSRSLIFIVLMAVMLMYFSTIKFTKKTSILSIFLLLIGMISFGILGNLRSGVGWNDNYYINAVGEIKGDDWLPDIFNWTYLYLTTPLANLEYNIQHVEPVYNFKLFVFENFIPDFVSKRFIDEATGVLLINPAFNVSTAFTAIHNNFGLVGMYFLFAFYVLINIIYINVISQSNKFYTLGIAVLTTLMMLTFFVNSYMYSGWSFILAFPVLYVICNFIINKLKIRYYLNEIILRIKSKV